jgi:hypothetical protein
VESERVGRECEPNTGSSMSNDCGLAIDIDGAVSSAVETTSIRLRPQKTRRIERGVRSSEASSLSSERTRFESVGLSEQL